MPELPDWVAGGLRRPFAMVVGPGERPCHAALLKIDCLRRGGSDHLGYEVQTLL